MDLHDLEHEPPTIDPTPRPYLRSARRQQPEVRDGKPVFTLRPSHLLAAAISIILIAGLVILFSQFSGQPIKVQPTIAPQPTDAMERAFLAPPTIAPEAPRATEAPDLTIIPSATPAPLSVAPVQPPMTGQGMTIAQDQPAEVAPADQYIQNVGAQAAHSPRGDGQAGPAGGDYVIVPTITSQQAEIIGQQAPHKVR